MIPKDIKIIYDNAAMLVNSAKIFNGKAAAKKKAKHPRCRSLSLVFDALDQWLASLLAITHLY